MEKFKMVVAPLFNKMQAHRSQLNTLENLRGDLLPKLMGGEGERLKIMSVIIIIYGSLIFLRIKKLKI